MLGPVPTVCLQRLEKPNLHLGYNNFDNESQYSETLAYLISNASGLTELLLGGVLPDFHNLMPSEAELLKLETLVLGGCRYKSKAETALYWLLSRAPNVERICLSSMAVTDAVFHRVMAVNTLSSLKALRMSWCAITTETAKTVMLATPGGMTREVEFESCHLVAECDQHAILHDGKVNGWNVSNSDDM